MNPETIRQRLASLDHPLISAVAEWRVALGPDDTGEPAVDVVIVLRDAEARRVWKQRSGLREVVMGILREMAPGRWPYVHFSAESEALNPEAAA